MYELDRRRIDMMWKRGASRYITIPNDTGNLCGSFHGRSPRLREGTIDWGVTEKRRSSPRKPWATHHTSRQLPRHLRISIQLTLMHHRYWPSMHHRYCTMGIGRAGGGAPCVGLLPSRRARNLLSLGPGSEGWAHLQQRPRGGRTSMVLGIQPRVG